MDFNAINASKLGRFKAAIEKQAEEEAKRLTMELRAKDEEVSKVRAGYELHKESAKIRAERNAAEIRIKKEISRCESEIERAALSHRKELIDGFFEELREELQRFTESGEYDKYIKKSLDKAADELGSDFVVLARQCDLDRVKRVTNAEVRVDHTIIIGGICAMSQSKGLFADYSFDNSLKEEKQAFVSRKELML